MDFMQRNGLATAFDQQPHRLLYGVCAKCGIALYRKQGNGSNLEIEYWNDAKPYCGIMCVIRAKNEL
jgi:hypothetical protein